MSDHYEPTERTGLNRLRHKAVFDAAAVHAILDSARVGTLAWADGYGQPFALPMAYVRDGGRLLFHGSTGGGMLRALAAGARCCFNVFHEDGLVLARSAFESSFQYRSVTVLGVCEELADVAKRQAMDTITEGLFPARARELRPMSDKEVAATLVLALPLDELSCKVSAGWPDDSAEDLDWPVWAGVLPVRKVFGEPLPAPDLREEFGAVPPYLSEWRA